MQKYILFLCEKLEDLFGVREYSSNYVFLDRADTEGTFAEIQFDPTYFRYTIYFYEDVIDMFEAKEMFYDVTEGVVHEFCHLLTDPVFNLAIDGASRNTERFYETIREQQTQRTAQVIMKNLPLDYFYNPKKHANKKRA